MIGHRARARVLLLSFVGGAVSGGCAATTVEEVAGSDEALTATGRSLGAPLRAAGTCRYGHSFGTVTKWGPPDTCGSAQDPDVVAQTTVNFTFVQIGADVVARISRPIAPGPNGLNVADAFEAASVDVKLDASGHGTGTLETTDARGQKHSHTYRVSLEGTTAKLELFAGYKLNFQNSYPSYCNWDSYSGSCSVEATGIDLKLDNTPPAASSVLPPSTLRSMAGTCMEIGKPNGPSTEWLVVSPCAGRTPPAWTLTDGGQVKAPDGRCVVKRGPWATLEACSTSPAQHLAFTGTKLRSLRAGTRNARCVSGVGLGGGKKAPFGSPLDNCTSSLALDATFGTDGTISSKASLVGPQGVAYCVTAAAAAPGADGRVSMEACNGGANQRWRVVAGGQVRSELGTCLDTPDGNRVVARACDGSAGQTWGLKGKLQGPDGQCLIPSRYFDGYSPVPASTILNFGVCYQPYYGDWPDWDIAP